ncbi:unnamed protein product [Triticum turgidum subsp. durum]|uniref:Disease resistance N-terminal domain-containing protein n=1 Tax=Triticum turgidum subsp. durum TaxID=4567 RepID=A0A9R0ZS50_TRITD|nr:unnamed protein product [Triticum turgidum subsp. durum]
MAESAIGSVLGNVSTLAVQETTFLCGVNLEAGFLKDELKWLKSYLKSADAKRRSGDELVATWVSQIDAAYEAENAIEAADYMEKRNRLKKGFMGAISRMEEGTMPKLSDLTLWLWEKMSKLPVGLLHLQSLDHLKLTFMPQISEDDITLKELRRKGCEDQLHCFRACN